MSVQPGHIGSGDLPHRAVTISVVNDPAAWCFFCCTTESLLCTAGEVIVLRVEGEVDLCTLPILQAAVGEGLDHHPAHLLVDLAGMTFCSVQGLELLIQTSRITTDNATSFAVSGVPPRIDRVWTLVGDRDLPIRHRSTAAAMTAIGSPSKTEPLKGGPRPRLDRTLGEIVIILGIILLVAGFLLAIPILWTLGIILVVVGVILAVLGSAGRAVGGRRHYY
jgi:anti-anti-sigma factor